MKLIIDIEESDLYAIKTNQYYGKELEKIIANGTPYNPSGDYISREALQNLTCGIIDEEGNIHQVVMLADIDNAPTVEPRRPKGLWTFDEKGYFYCDQCGKYPRDQYATTDFCSKCGADMRGKEE